MKVFLLQPDRDFDPSAALPAGSPALIQDLGLDILFAAMADGNAFLLEVAKVAILASLDDQETIRYRQAILTDCLAKPELVRGLYALSVEAIEAERQVWGSGLYWLPDTLLSRSVEVLHGLVAILGRMRALAAEHQTSARSEGFRRLLAEMATELDDAYLRTVEDHLERLRFRDGIVLSAELGTANRGTNHVLRRRITKPSWRERILDRIGLRDANTYVYRLPDRDEEGAKALAELRGRGIALAADALGRSADHIVAYVRQLRWELGFYVGCLNLHAMLAGKGEPTCMPEPRPVGPPAISARGLFDPCLSLRAGRRVVGNDLDADGTSMLVITGANRGGKSTLLRSLGVAQLMMQCGMFVAAESFQADVRLGVFTHFKREEDGSLKSGKLDEELGRMSAIVDQLGPHSLVLLNESFASTNEREGAEIGRQIVRALLEAGVKVGYVTHMFELADGLFRERSPGSLFLRAERLPDGQRTFRVVEGEPLPTSHGADVYRRVFGAPPGSADGVAATQ
jgi:DNA mismatch repair ATPase MutS